ncbi:Hsp20/alpha crystallin family protein [Cohnella sp. AR92]|uniref:Hsp20/alpha crystallin family protein n=1 Tax=Cohnella sp. AR92 TaxID=648716 RepID=UPI000F8D5731|nr:Hsp20/alpha crystallin family protein [Cohnella sp. AR92]RUS47472.1 Hsp20/alpha crystallin family protein [Cohnella sp. AR92]
MALVPYEPFRRLDSFRREWDRFFSDEQSLTKHGTLLGLGHMTIDVHETDAEVVATCDIPGLEKKEDVDIEVENNLLTISGMVNRKQEVKEDRMHRQERFYGRFHRSISLPSNVTSEGIQASYRNGVLEVRMPKQKGDSRKRIDVQFH